MTEVQLAQLQWLVLGLAGILSTLLGALLHRSHFCTMGAVSDAVVMGSFDRMRQWALALSVAILGFGAMTYLELITPLKSAYATGVVFWFSAFVGGLLFGWGMVWSSGCGAKSLVRLGTGNLKSLLVLLVMGIVALATLRGILAFPRVQILEAIQYQPQQGLFASQWLSAVAELPFHQAALIAAVFFAVILGAWVLFDRPFRRSHNVMTGLGVGLVICCMWWISGVLGHGSEHPETLDEFFLATSSRKMEAISLTAPIALGLDALLYFTDGTKRLSLGMISVLGISLGALISAKLQGTFKWESFSNLADLKRHLVGGSCMGVGAVLAMGCSLGQGLSGLSTLSFASLLATIGILSGAYAALRHDLNQVD